ncbi:hypothetical protein LZZ85_04755 [Terrimonas sp. NA20]|uniref:RHS repeat-associated core domain-containing protein n=1 Tax=Terrimonas ginsenosidimutans TaxID=2908004 RepID=A0ABS9KMQ6_9BACT|nr:RHS repeat-associated core domain-containing protein [Terrimonas ginsenosidimutans]MCG2613575.1 hypothetical protein [Terrimonas ginsenosidimutans]
MLRSGDCRRRSICGRYAVENQVYDIVDTRRIDKTAAGAGSQSSFENKVCRVHGGLTGEKTGLGVTLKVMSGDQVKISAESFYPMPGGGSPGSSISMTLSELLTSFVQSNIISAAGHSGVSTSGVSGAGANSSLLPLHLGGLSEGANNARAFVNWILFDDQFKFVAGDAEPVKEFGGYKLHTKFVNLPVQVTKNGFLYIYVSNESNLPVYFDNLVVTHTPGALVEESHYYPFGLTMAGINSKALAFGEPGNKIKYNNMELQSEEFSDGVGLQMYEYKYRFYDYQIGRFISQDGLADKYNHYAPYQFAGNQVPNAIDQDGLEPYLPNYAMEYRLAKEFGRTD